MASSSAKVFFITPPENATHREISDVVRSLKRSEGMVKVDEMGRFPNSVIIVTYTGQDSPYGRLAEVAPKYQVERPQIHIADGQLSIDAPSVFN